MDDLKELLVRLIALMLLGWSAATGILLAVKMFGLI